MDHEGEEPDPSGQFDAFRARRADERAQQEEMETSYVFPAQYAADPDPYFGQVQTRPVALPPAEPRSGRMRSVLIFAGAVLVACALGVGAWLAFDSSGSSANAAASGVSASPTTPAKRTLTFRVTITSVGAASFRGTVLANGDPVTVALTADTRFGTKARRFSRADLRVGETVIVRGERTSTDTVTATLVA